ncbi:MAG: hypothetical protein AAGA99_26480 [Actinomycetota bacterium]
MATLLVDTADHRTIGLGVALAAAAVVVASSLVAVGRADGARAITVHVRRDAITVHVRDVIDEPDVVVEQLRSSGVPASIEPVAAPTELDGQVISVGAIGSDAPQTFDDDGDHAIDRIVLDGDFAGSLVISVGDRDAPTGSVTAAAAPAGCGELVDRPIADVEDELAELGDAIRWYRAELEAFGGVQTEAVDRTAIADEEHVVEVLVDGDGLVLVTISSRPETLPPPAVDPCPAKSAD